MASQELSTDLGVIYTATQEPWIREAAVSASSLKKLHPDIPVVLFSDIPVSADCFDRVVVANGIPDGISERHWHKDFGQKLFFLPRSPFARTLYLDTDTQVLAPLDTLLELLDDVDFAAAPQAVDADSYSALPSGTPEWQLRNPRECRALEYNPEFFFNAGILLYKQSDALRSFFEAWWKIWAKAAEGVMDQDVFNSLVSEGRFEQLHLKFLRLENKVYNVRPVMIPHLNDEECQRVCILHSRVAALNEQLFAKREKR